MFVRALHNWFATTTGTGKHRQTGCEHISFTAEAGGIYSLIGLNGAGKSTILTIIGGYCRPSSGDVRICGSSLLEDPEEAKRHTGVLYEQNPLYDSMTVKEFLFFTLQMRGIAQHAQQDAVDHAIEFTDLQDVYRRRIKGLSKGYRQPGLQHENRILALNLSSYIQARFPMLNVSSPESILILLYSILPTYRSVFRCIPVKNGTLIITEQHIQTPL